LETTREWLEIGTPPDYVTVMQRLDRYAYQTGRGRIKIILSEDSGAFSARLTEKGQPGPKTCGTDTFLDLF